MADIKRVELLKKPSLDGEVAVLRFDWDNDRHQEIELYDNGPKDVIYALKCAVHKLEQEYHGGYLS